MDGGCLPHWDEALDESTGIIEAVYFAFYSKGTPQGGPAFRRALLWGHVARFSEMQCTSFRGAIFENAMYKSTFCCAFLVVKAAISWLFPMRIAATKTRKSTFCCCGLWGAAVRHIGGSVKGTLRKR